MNAATRHTLIVIAVVLSAVMADQALKLWVHAHLAVGEAVQILPFFQLCHVENDGMAFGIEWFDKFFLTLFRMGAAGVLCWYMHRLIRPKDGVQVRTGYLVMVALVTAGAVGNIIDCVFYGRLFGYAGWFYGRVVDMLYFPLVTDSAGECLFFRPVFNIADSCITVAVFAVLIWFRKDLDRSVNSRKKEEA
jgi:signal peptidase II